MKLKLALICSVLDDTKYFVLSSLLTQGKFGYTLNIRTGIFIIILIGSFCPVCSNSRCILPQLFIMFNTVETNVNINDLDISIKSNARDKVIGVFILNMS